MRPLPALPEAFRPKPAEQRPLTPHEQQLLVRLGGYLPSGETVCHGYENVCGCPRCLKRQALTQEHGFRPDGQLAVPGPTRQPWESRPARAARKAA